MELLENNYSLIQHLLSYDLRLNFCKRMSIEMAIV